MKVLMLIPDFYPTTGGAERQCLKLSEELIKQGVAVKVLTRSPGTGVVTSDQVHGVPVEYLKKTRPFELAVIKWFVQLWKRRHDFDIFHLHMVNEHTLGALIVAFLVKKPVIIKFANSGNYFDVRRILEFGRKPTNILIAKCLRCVDRYVSISQAVTKDIADHGYDLNKIEIIPNGVEKIPRLDSVQKQKMRRDLGIPDNMIVFVRIGSLLPKKGVSVLCESWERVVEKNNNCFLLSVGGLELPEEINTFHKKHRRTTDFVLNQPDGVKKYLQVADVFVLPSLAEGLSNALLEALSAGLPSIVTNVGGNSELVTNGENGLVVHSGDPTGLASAILDLAANPEKRKRMAERANRKLDNYSIEFIASRYHQLYENLLAERLNTRSGN